MKNLEVFRKCFVGILKSDYNLEALTEASNELGKSIDSLKILTISVSVYENLLIIYVETLDDNFNINSTINNFNKFLVKSNFLNYKDFYVNFTKIFSYVAKLNLCDILRAEIKKPTIKIARLNREDVNSYIYYHYLLQEGVTTKVNKFGSIFLLDNYAIMYDETPVEYFQVVASGKCDDFVPPENWLEIMTPHFIKIKDNLWNDTNLIFTANKN